MANPVANLSDAAESQALEPANVRDASELKGEVHQPGGGEHAVESVDNVLGFNTTGWVAVAALVVIVLMLVQKVPAAIGRMLDARIAGIREQLDEAKRLRAEAEALRAEYEAKARSAHDDAETMRAHARQEAAAVLAKAKADAAALMDRRAKMAEDKIAAAERTALAEVRAKAADAAARAAGLILAERHDAGADRAMVDRTIAGLGRLN
jgi:F-type H+-transporting ATPase subunit b